MGRRAGEEAAVEAHEGAAARLGVGDGGQAEEGQRLGVVGDDDDARHERLKGGDDVLDEGAPAEVQQGLGGAHAAARAARQDDAGDVVVARHG